MQLIPVIKEHFTNKEHGGKSNSVPSEWSKYKNLTSVYSLSSLSYCVVGILFFCCIPEQYRLYKYEIYEGFFWIWQGLISFQCDAVDLGIISISHPIDRISATVFVLWGASKFILLSIKGMLSWKTTIIFPIGITIGLYFFYKSNISCIKKKDKDYFYWHTLWHFSFPAAAFLFYIIHWRLLSHNIINDSIL